MADELLGTLFHNDLPPRGRELLRGNGNGMKF